MEFIFSIQGEGRGHISQAIAMYELLVKNNHTVSDVFIGISNQRELPDYFFSRFEQCRVHPVQSPNFVKLTDKKGIAITRSFVKNLFKLPTFKQSMRTILKVLNSDPNKVVLNFYEPLMGCAYLCYKPKNLHYSFAHHFITGHDDFPAISGNYLNKRYLKWLNNLTSFGCEKIFALSFSTCKPYKNNKYIVSPPLLRTGIKEKPSTNREFILVYVLNHGYLKEIIQWHAQFPDLELVVFSDGLEEFQVNPHQKMTLFRTSEEMFIKHLKQCKAVICTAGFETICEAFYLNKMPFVFPVKRHFEQLCNAYDAQKHGAAFVKSIFEITPEILNSRLEKRDGIDFMNWYDKAESFYLHELTNN